ncbi:hypothetical protein BU26DRAFT_144628 [Trematosphaeria pertusa]|uniref:Uncharacterized protein n=1 Tax=Trematosphaeria pertusa TaxID=390896 RepID=A0A6A6J024_9PLEO|nr:uncharacterized protein BU26DRAFT_144628 [Trematosphaeria pertusa]KAF2254753.1 hypothetical protein BU26DRAFT_144628 [Trematosphaeria pertusa]
MKLLTTITLTTLLSLNALAAPTPAKSTVTLRLITSLSQHYAYADAQQNPSLPSGSLLHVVVGQALSLDNAPLQLQAIEIMGVSEGDDLSSPPRRVQKADPGVVCTALTGFSSRGVRFSVEDGAVGLSDVGGVVAVTGLECGLA